MQQRTTLLSMQNHTIQGPPLQEDGEARRDGRNTMLQCTCCVLCISKQYSIRRKLTAEDSTQSQPYDCANWCLLRVFMMNCDRMLPANSSVYARCFREPATLPANS